DQRLEATDQEEDERRRTIHDADLLVLDSGEPVHDDAAPRGCSRSGFDSRSCHMSAHCLVRRKATSARASASVIGGTTILVPVLNRDGSWIQCARFSSLFTTEPEAIILRVPMPLRLGPMSAVGAPTLPRAWQPTHALVAKSWRPCATSSSSGTGATSESVGGAGGRVAVALLSAWRSATHASNSAGSLAIT